ncbi:MAG: hypothetical protein ACM3X1_07275, partial [Ignavibacteriales bacterium]
MIIDEIDKVILSSLSKNARIPAVAWLPERAVEGTDVSFKFSKEKEDKSLLDFSAGQFAFFDIGEVYNDPKGPIRHFTISSSPTEDFIMFSTRIRDSPYKRRVCNWCV